MSQTQIYAQMKDSGVAWLGDIPAEWNVVRGKFRYQNLKERNTGLVEPQRLALTLKGVIERQDDDDVGLNPESLESYQIFEQGDLVFKLIDLENKQTSRVGLVPKRGIMSPAYIRLTPTVKIYAKYYYYFYYSLYLNYVYNNIAREGVRANISAKELLEIQVPYAEYKTQQRIADYLDRETAQIDDLITKQQRLLDLLEEKRRATITHAVTRGLNPHAELKETNITWLGQIPAHWRFRKAKYLFDRAKDAPLETDDVVTAFRDGEVVLRSLRRTEGFTFADKEIGYQHVSKGDLVIHAMDGFAGAIGISKSEGKMSPVCSICRPKNEQEVNAEYFAQLVRTMAKSDWLTAIAKGIRERSTDFRWADFANMEFPLPPIAEQLSIISTIREEELKVGVIEQKINEQIDLLKERRTSLISSAVTGKIKV